jgi:acetolactate synthase-1/2/3 large subunit
MRSDNTPIHPFRLVREIRDFIDRDATVIGDGGDIVTFGARVIEIFKPGHWLDPGAFGCLGVGTGYAIAAKLARPQEQVLILNGDGSFGLNGFDFETMVRHKLPVVSVIGNDGAWGQNKHPQLDRFGHAVAQELSQDVRYDKVVEAFGGYGETVTDPNEIRPALERAFAAGVPACVNVLTDQSVRYGHSGAATH